MSAEHSRSERKPVYYEGVPSNQTLERFGLKRRPRFIAEIGYGKYPVPFFGNLRFGQYVGFEASDYTELRDTQFTEFVHEKLIPFQVKARGERLAERISFQYGDAVRDNTQGRNGLPLSDSIATEVYIGNVLNRDFKHGDRERIAVVNEAKRILDDNGSLIIKTSWWNDAINEYPQERIGQLLTTAGFSIVNTCVYIDPEYGELEKRYGKTPRKYIPLAFIDQEDYSAYYIVARKAGDGLNTD